MPSYGDTAGTSSSVYFFQREDPFLLNDRGDSESRFSIILDSRGNSVCILSQLTAKGICFPLGAGIGRRFGLSIVPIPFFMSVVLARIRSKTRGGPVRWKVGAYVLSNIKRRATILESICFSYVFERNAYYFRFSYDGRLLCIISRVATKVVGMFKPDSSVVYILSWFYETKQVSMIRYFHCIRC